MKSRISVLFILVFFFGSSCLAFAYIVFVGFVLACFLRTKEIFLVNRSFFFGLLSDIFGG